MKMLSSNQLWRGIRNPRLAASYAAQNARTVYTGLYRLFYGISRQQAKIREFTSQDEFVLIILDACRFDVFRDHYQSYLDGELDRVWSAGRWTAQYTERTWRGMYELTYLTAIPVVSDYYFEQLDTEYRPSDHFQQLIPLWDQEWDESVGTVPPERVTNSALSILANESDTRMVVHYAQPHGPFIGENKLLPWDSPPGSRDELLRGDEANATERIYDALHAGDISDETLKTAYVDNLNRVLEEVVRLLKYIDAPVVITGDHGEHLGERGRYLHQQNSPVVRQVPWFQVADNHVKNIQIPESYASESIHASPIRTSGSDVEDRLADLGYK